MFRHVNLLVSPKDPRAVMSFIIMEPQDTPPMQGSNSICVATVFLDTGIVPQIIGRACITGTQQHLLDPDDPWPAGYRLSDAWPGGGGRADAASPPATANRKPATPCVAAIWQRCRTTPPAR